MSSRLITKIKYNHLYLNGSHCSVNSTVQPGDIVCVDFNYNEDNGNIVSNPQIKLDILYEDELYIIINKPSNMPVHPSMENIIQIVFRMALKLILTAFICTKKLGQLID